MNWIEFSRLNQAVEMLSPNRSVNLLSKDFIPDNNFINILSLDLPVNNLASKKALKWIVSSLEVFEEEIEMAIYTHGDIGEAVYHFDEGSNDSNLTLNSVTILLSMDCSKSGGDSYRKFHSAFSSMSALEKKWFLRYWLRTPRNGINSGMVRKLLAKVYDKKPSEVKKHTQLHSLAEISNYYAAGNTPPNNLLVGRFITPMLAKAVPKEDWPKEYIVEYKYDGARYQIHSGNIVGQGKSLIIFNRKGKVVTSKFPDIGAIVNGWDIGVDFIIDTEIFPVNEDGTPAPFKKMGTRIHSKDIQAAIEKCPVELSIFDCMMFNVENLMDLPLKTRLDTILKFPKQAVRTVVKEDNDVFYNLAINEGYEGIMVKDLNSTYESGKRSKGWAKYKPPRVELDVVIIGARYGDGKRSTVFGSYDIAVKGIISEFIPVGSIGTGFSDIDLLYLTNECKKIIERVSNGTYELLPRVVLEVTADLVTMDAKGNLGLRFPRMLRIRTDKPVADINTIQDISEMM